MWIGNHFWLSVLGKTIHRNIPCNLIQRLSKQKQDLGLKHKIKNIPVVGGQEEHLVSGLYYVSIPHISYCMKPSALNKSFSHSQWFFPVCLVASPFLLFLKTVFKNHCFSVPPKDGYNWYGRTTLMTGGNHTVAT